MSALVVLAIGFFLVPSAFASHMAVTVENAPGSSSPGCEPNCFLPSTVIIDLGSTVTWVNNDNAAHTTTSGSPTGGPDGSWDSSIVMPGDAYTIEFVYDGTYPYFCMVHPWMEGTVIVNPSSTAAPTPPAVTPTPSTTSHTSYYDHPCTDIYFEENIQTTRGSATFLDCVRDYPSYADFPDAWTSIGFALAQQGDNIHALDFHLKAFENDPYGCSTQECTSNIKWLMNSYIDNAKDKGTAAYPDQLKQYYFLAIAVGDYALREGIDDSSIKWTYHEALEGLCYTFNDNKEYNAAISLVEEFNDVTTYLFTSCADDAQHALRLIAAEEAAEEEAAIAAQKAAADKVAAEEAAAIAAQKAAADKVAAEEAAAQAQTDKIAELEAAQLAADEKIAELESAQEEGGGCLIATAAYGSEMAPQVQFLREIRDNTVLQTQSGASFMTAFNSFYYTFSPTIADDERENPVFKEAVKVGLTPLLTSLTILNYVDIDTEQEMLGYGIGIIMLNIGMYFVAPAVVIITLSKKLRK